MIALVRADIRKNVLTGIMLYSKRYRNNVLASVTCTGTLSSLGTFQSESRNIRERFIRNFY